MLSLALAPDPTLSSHQVFHLRNQMTSMLHALSSTFTTCACGAKAKDCALTLMAAFVDGEVPDPHALLPSSTNDMSPNGARLPRAKVDIGPLVGVERGFRTRETSPLNGGMNGVEMVPSIGSSPAILVDKRNIVNNVGSSETRARSQLHSPNTMKSNATGKKAVSAASVAGPIKDRRGKSRAHRKCLSMRITHRIILMYTHSQLPR